MCLTEKNYKIWTCICILSGIAGICLGYAITQKTVNQISKKQKYVSVN